MQIDKCEGLGPHDEIGSKEIRYERHVAHGRQYKSFGPHNEMGPVRESMRAMACKEINMTGSVPIMEWGPKR